MEDNTIKSRYWAYKESLLNFEIELKKQEHDLEKFKDLFVAKGTYDEKFKVHKVMSMEIVIQMTKLEIERIQDKMKDFVCWECQ